jgi:hypothetical protein
MRQMVESLWQFKLRLARSGCDRKINSLSASRSDGESSPAGIAQRQIHVKYAQKSSTKSKPLRAVIRTAGDWIFIFPFDFKHNPLKNAAVSIVIGRK